MAPTGESACRCQEDNSTAALAALSDEDLQFADPGPFYGMFDSSDVDNDWIHARLSSPRLSTVIPEASETFQRVMRQLDDVDEVGAGQSPSSSGSEATKHKDKNPCSEKRGERKPSKMVKKSASFTAPASRPVPSISKDASAVGGDSRRRMSVPCLRSNKHVQWADEAGVSDLVSVRLIRPRLAKGDKEEVTKAPSRSILRRRSGIH